LTFDASVNFPKDEPPPDGSDIADRLWRLAIYDQASEPKLGSADGTVGIVRWSSTHSSDKRYGCLVQCEMKATLFSRLVNYLQAGNRLVSAEISIDFTRASLDEKGNTAPVLVISVEGGFNASTNTAAAYPCLQADA